MIVMENVEEIYPPDIREIKDVALIACEIESLHNPEVLCNVWDKSDRLFEVNLVDNLVLTDALDARVVGHAVVPSKTFEVVFNGNAVCRTGLSRSERKYVLVCGEEKAVKSFSERYLR
ncbi:MAG: hypothetical protein ACXQS2_06490 [Methermicoccaceae archaeon]